MNSHDRREINTPLRTKQTATDASARSALAEAQATNYPPKVRYLDSALPNSHRPTSA